MNELEFKHHLKDLAHGKHHPEEHDWGEQAGAAKVKAPAKAAGGTHRPKRKAPKKKSS